VCPTDAENPYVGPRPFEARDAIRFFGRDHEIRALRALVSAHRVVLLYAQSAAGKTSLLNAGLIPHLEDEGFDVLPRARVSGIEPASLDADTNVFVVHALESLSAGGATEIRGRTLPEALAAAFAAHETDPSAPRVVLFDQLEELFTRHPERWRDRRGFLEQVARALDDDPRLRVLLSIREDYLAHLDPYARLFDNQLRVRFRLERLREPAALQAITGPLAATTRSFEPDAANALVRALSRARLEVDGRELVTYEGEFVEPVLLQVVCREIWDALPSTARAITRSHTTALGDLKEILSRFYERGLRRVAAATRTRQSPIRRLFDRHLITSAGTRAIVHREAKKTGGVPNKAVCALEGARLIRAVERAGASWYEITHDTMVDPIRSANARWHRKRRGRRLAVAAAALVALGGLAGSLPTMWSTQSLDWAAGVLTIRTAFGARTIGAFDAEFDERAPYLAGGYGMAIGERITSSDDAGTLELDVLESLGALAQDGGAVERMAASHVIAEHYVRTGNARTLEKWVSGHAATSAELKERAIDALARLWSTQTHSTLWAIATDARKPDGIRLAAARAAHAGDPASVAELEETARTGTADVLRRAAGEQLGPAYAVAYTERELATMAKASPYLGIRVAAAAGLAIHLERVGGTATAQKDLLAQIGQELADMRTSPHPEYAAGLAAAFSRLFERHGAEGLAGMPPPLSELLEPRPPALEMAPHR